MWMGNNKFITRRINSESSYSAKIHQIEKTLPGSKRLYHRSNYRKGAWEDI